MGLIPNACTYRTVNRMIFHYINLLYYICTTAIYNDIATNIHIDWCDVISSGKRHQFRLYTSRDPVYVTAFSVTRHQAKYDDSLDPKMTSSDRVFHVSGCCIMLYQSQCYTSVSSIGVDSSLCSELNPVSEFESLS